MTCAVVYRKDIPFSLMSPRETIPLYDKIFWNVERCLDVLGFLPVISLASGSLRILMGQVQAVFWGVLGFLAYIGALIQPDFCLQTVASRDFHYAIHGLGNVLRGFVESCFLAGNIAGFLYTLVARVRYPTEWGELVDLEGQSLADSVAVEESLLHP